MTNDPANPIPKPPAFVSLGGRRRLLYVLLVPAALAFGAALLVWKIPDVNVWQIPELPLFLLCGVVVLGYCAFAFLWWRCPLCGTYLGRDFHPEKCAGCGVYFED